MVEAVNIWVIRIPLAASWSTFGVMATAFPAYPRSHHDRSSAIKSTILGLSGKCPEQEDNIRISNISGR